MSLGTEVQIPRSWKTANSTWLLWSILGFGLFTWVGFLIHGIKAKSKPWLISAAVWFVLFVLNIVINESLGTSADKKASGLYGGFILACWVGGIFHSVISNKSWLNWAWNRKMQSLGMESQAKTPVQVKQIPTQVYETKIESTPVKERFTRKPVMPKVKADKTKVEAVPKAEDDEQPQTPVAKKDLGPNANARSVDSASATFLQIHPNKNSDNNK